MDPISYPFSLGRYTLLKPWKSDDWGVEFLARQESLAGCTKLVLLKTLAKQVATDPTFVSLFLNEARIAARLSHPNIIQIYELGETNGEYFIAMEYVHGHLLDTVLETMQEKAQLFLPILAAQLCIQILLGLRYAHMQEDEQGCLLNLVHKNLCPSNVLLGFNGAVKVCNFGIPRTTFLEAGGKPTFYVAPEQHVDGRIDARVDVYATGVLLAELLLGKIPHHCADTRQLAESVRQRPGISPALADIVACALCLKRDERFESAREMALALEHYIEAAGASQITVELSNFLHQLFGKNTQNPWLIYESSPAIPALLLPDAPDEKTRPEFPLPTPRIESAEETKETLEICSPEVSPRALLRSYFKWALAGFWMMLVLGGVAWWLWGD
ncbi:MAG: serine/threonine protein kinase [Proteobacteria bacterium]|nr:serine/threonine protein kinase [Cystobacterineae bacterium]MCL2313816.1 serine/threonine protein kinase [Pseudomonadota bacterium]